MVAGGTIGKPFFALPTDYCPSFYHVFAVQSNNALGRVTAGSLSSGCIVYADTGSNVWVSLDGVSYQWWVLDGRENPSAAATAKTSAKRTATPSTRVRQRPIK
jgi:hypothetical protein